MVAFDANAQKTVTGLINAEKNFSAYCEMNGTKDAFLKFLDSNGVVFEQGKAVNGIEVWNKKEKRAGILKWHPQFAEIASSNDFGYTSGPWTFQQNSTTDSVIARGQYFTIWHLDKNGEWKFLADLGVGNTPENFSTHTKIVTAKKLTGDPDTDPVVKAEEAFENSFHQNILKAYRDFLSSRIILLRNGRLPATSVDDQVTVVKNTPPEIEFTIAASGIAPSGDLAYVYGNITVNNKQDNYLHIWRREKTGWKIALEVLRY